MSLEARFEDSPIRRGVTVVVLMAVLVLARRLLGRPAAALATRSTRTEALVAPDAGSTWAEDLVADRRFEWSLIAREIAAVLIIALLIVARELLS
jgi:hypothetical protein